MRSPHSPLLTPSQLVGAQDLITPNDADEPTHQSPSLVPFTSITEAHDTLGHFHHVHTCNAPYQNLHATAPLRTARTHKSALALSTWSSALRTFLNTRGAALTPVERSAANVLKMQSLIYMTTLKLDNAQLSLTNQLHWDAHIATFERVVSLAEAIYGISPPTSPASTSGDVRRLEPTFTLDIGIVAPLFDVACRCRDPGIRRRAVHVLTLSDRQEGIYSSGLAAIIARGVIEVEEEGLDVKVAGDVPGWKRVVRVGRSFDGEGRRARLEFFTMGMGEGQGEGAPVVRVVDF
ncbi:hypothetical protein C1H76_5948 [Elsinoe australis]|uniref:Uncharacterized protein n=1 Tax=Elsinoe australis TaxID=40998 RepID=A0A4U7B1B2_9PEZI|nr:hypothetical protein C1H76_5948 [Elsinoe australis]